MKSEIILRRENGSRMKIECSVWIDFRSTKSEYEITVSICEKGKRKFHDVVNNDSWDRRKLDMKDRPVYDHEQQLKYVTL